MTTCKPLFVVPSLSSYHEKSNGAAIMA